MATETWKKEHQEDLRRYRREHYYRNREHYLSEVRKAKARKREELLSKDLDFQKYIAAHPTKKCSKCQLDIPTINFPIHSSNGRRYPNHECSPCQGIRRRNCTSDESKKDRNKRKNEISKEKRADPMFRSKFIVSDCRTSDKKFGRNFDLDIPFVDDAINRGCEYCGQRDGMMVMDRIDNTKGHLKENVKPACFRCNDIRSNMPYEAWVVLVPAIKQAYEWGLFGEWKIKKC